MSDATPSQLISIPDRFEGLQRRAQDELRSIIVPVEHSLGEIDRLHQDMTAAERGAFLVLRGASGAGKSTFLHTVGMFREGVETLSVPPNVDLREFLRSDRAAPNA